MACNECALQDNLWAIKAYMVKKQGLTGKEVRGPHEAACCSGSQVLAAERTMLWRTVLINGKKVCCVLVGLFCKDICGNFVLSARPRLVHHTLTTSII
jgi:hypothetical protein